MPIIRRHGGDLREIGPVHELREGQLSDMDLFIGVEARVLLTALEEEDIAQTEIIRSLRYFINNDKLYLNLLCYNVTT